MHFLHFNKKMELSKIEVNFLNKYFIQRSNNQNSILDKFTKEKLLFILILIRVMIKDFWY